MATMDGLLGYIPTQTIADSAIYGAAQRLTIHNQIPARPYAEPTHFGFAGVPGPFTVAGIYEVTETEFLQQRPQWTWNNAQIVSVPERPVDKGTWDAIVSGSKSGLQYLQPNSGVYLQPNVIGSSLAIAGQAPYQGVYTGLGVNNGIYEGESC